MIFTLSALLFLLVCFVIFNEMKREKIKKLELFIEGQGGRKIK